jgi:exodeoxyribonuclease VII large subunit
MAESPNKTNAAEFSVSEISGSLKRVVEDTFGHVRVRGEISGYRGPHSSGHSYFALKDDRAKIDAIIWRGVAGRIKHPPEEGLEVIATGKLTTYPGRSSYQIVIENLEPAGAGALMALLEERKKKLAGEGLFAEDRKQLLPYLPTHIGVVTSPTGAVIRDVLHRLADRFPTRVTVWPVRVQGDTSGAEVANAIEGFNRAEPQDRPDLLIVARGGGSLEDLWGFNDESVVRAAAASQIPLISAVGHETDWTLIDYAADVRAPTPTGAAEMAVPVRADLVAHVSDRAARLSNVASRMLEQRRSFLVGLARSISSPERVLEIPTQRFDQASQRHAMGLRSMLQSKRAKLNELSAGLRPRSFQDRMARDYDRVRATSRSLALAMDQNLGISGQKLRLLSTRLSPLRFAERTSHAKAQLDRTSPALLRAFQRTLKDRRQRLEASGRVLDSLSYKSVLSRGFALIRNDQGTMVSSVSSVTNGSDVTIEWLDGKTRAIISDENAPVSRPKPPSTPRKKASRAPDSGSQKSLF